MLAQIVGQLQAHNEGFDEAFYSLRDEVNFRRSQSPDGRLDDEDSFNC